MKKLIGGWHIDEHGHRVLNDSFIEPEHRTDPRDKQIAELQAELASTQKLREMDREQAQNMVRLVAEAEASLEAERKNLAEVQREVARLVELANNERKAHADLKAKLENATIVWMGREKDSDLHFLFTAEPEWDEEYQEWLSTNMEEMILGHFDSSLNPGESCKVRIVKAEDV
jgi:hypothetical protein